MVGRGILNDLLSIAMDISRKPHRRKKAASLAPTVVEARAITKIFGDRLAVDHLDLDVPARV